MRNISLDGWSRYEACDPAHVAFRAAWYAGTGAILLVDDHAVVREGYRRLLERHSDIAVIGEATDAATAHSLFCSLNPQIVIVDITLPGTSGIEAMRRMLVYRSDARVLIFSMRPMDTAIQLLRKATQLGQEPRS